MSDLIEPAVVLDTFVQGVGRVEEIAANLFRISYYTNQRGYDASQERVCVAKFIVTAETMKAMAADTFGRQEARRLTGETHSAMN